MMKKLDNNKGFTMVELLCALVVLVLLTSCVTLGINLATKSMGGLSKEANSQDLSGTLSMLITDELRFASKIKTDADGRLTSYYSFNQIPPAKIECVGGKIYVVDKYGEPWDIVSPEEYGGCKVDDLSVTYNPEKHIFTVNFVITDASGKVLKSTDFQVEAIKESANSKNTAESKTE